MPCYKSAYLSIDLADNASFHAKGDFNFYAIVGLVSPTANYIV